MSDTRPTAREYAGIGPVEARVVERLRDWDGAHGRFGTSIAQRSPVGPRAIRVWAQAAPDGSAGPLDELVDWLGAQPWVEEVATRPKHAYVRVTTDALRAWVAAGLTAAGPASGDEGRGRATVVRFVDSASLPSPSLDQFRETAAALAVGALLRSRGFEVTLDRVDPGERGPLAPDTLVVGTAPAPERSSAERVRVGEVDVRHGPLRARHGGSVSADDVLGELRGRLMRSDDPAVRMDGSAEELLSVALLRSERASRVQLDDDKLERELSAFEALASARRMVARGDHEVANADGDGENAIRELADALDMLPNTAARAASALDAALITRFRRSVVDRALAVHNHLPADDPLWAAVGEALDLALSLGGLDTPGGASEHEVNGGSGAGGAASVGGNAPPTDAREQAA